MKRNWDLIRDILLEIESLPPGSHASFAIDYSVTNEQRRGEHSKLLFEAGFIRGVCAHSTDCWQLLDAELTWQGHDLLAHLRSSTIWEKVKEKAIDKGFDLSFEAVMRIANTLIDAIS